MAEIESIHPFPELEHGNENSSTEVEHEATLSPATLSNSNISPANSQQILSKWHVQCSH